MIQLFKKGNPHEYIIVNEFGFENLIESGVWCLSQEECYIEPEVKLPESEKEDTSLEEKIEKAAKETKEAMEAAEDLKKALANKKSSKKK